MHTRGAQTPHKHARTHTRTRTRTQRTGTRRYSATGRSSRRGGSSRPLTACWSLVYVLPPPPPLLLPLSFPFYLSLCRHTPGVIPLFCVACAEEPLWLYTSCCISFFSCPFTHTRSRARAHTHPQKHTHICPHTRSHIRARKSVFIHAEARKRTRKHARTHARTHAHTHTSSHKTRTGDTCDGGVYWRARF